MGTQPPKKGHSPQFSAHVCNFRPMSVAAKRLDGSRCHLVRRWDSAETSKVRTGTGHSGPHFSAHVLWPNGWMPLGTEVGLGPGHILLHGDPGSHSPKRAQQPPIFGSCLLRPNGWMDQDAIWCGGRPRPWPHCVRWGPSPPQSGHIAPNFLPVSVWDKWLNESRCHLVWRLGPGYIVLDGDPAPF